MKALLTIYLWIQLLNPSQLKHTIAPWNNFLFLNFETESSYFWYNNFAVNCLSTLSPHELGGPGSEGTV